MISSQSLLDDRGSRGFGGAGRAFSSLRSLIRNLSSESDHGDVVELAAAGGMGANLLDEHLAGSSRSRRHLDQHAVEPGVAESLVLQIERVGHSVSVKDDHVARFEGGPGGFVLPVSLDRQWQPGLLKAEQLDVGVMPGNQQTRESGVDELESVACEVEHGQQERD